MKRWRCVICGEDILEGQRFTQLSEGYAHIECIREKAAEKHGSPPRDMEALLDALESALYGIVRAKEAARYASDEDVRRIIEKYRQMLEEEALIMSVALESYLKD